MGLIDEASHVLMARYREQFDPEVMTAAPGLVFRAGGRGGAGHMLLAFVEQFPGATRDRGRETPRQWLAGATGGMPHRAAAMEELLLLWTANRNEAFRPFEELFEDRTLAEKTVYRQVTRQLPEYFATRPLIPLPDAKPMSLLELLRAPAVGSPGSLADQLALIRKLWKPLLGDSLERLLDDRRRDSARGRAGHLDAVQSARPRRMPPPRPRAAAARAATAVAVDRQPRRGAGLRRSGARIREVLARHGLDAQRRC